MFWCFGGPLAWVGHSLVNYVILFKYLPYYARPAHPVSGGWGSSARQPDIQELQPVKKTPCLQIPFPPWSRADYNGDGNSDAALNHLDEPMREHSPMDSVGDTDARARGPDAVLGRRSAVFMLSPVVFSDELGECDV